MNESYFLVILIILGVIYAFKGRITKLINHKFFEENENFKIKSYYISYFLFFLLAITLLVGMLLGTKTKKTFSNVSKGFEHARTKGEDRPHPLFDIDTYW